MGLIRNVLSREAYAARIKEITAKHAYLSNPGSSIDIMPGWLDQLELLLDRIDSLADGKMTFLVAEMRSKSDSLNMYFESAHKSGGRHDAITNTIARAKDDLNGYCKFCGVHINHTNMSGTTAVCREHGNIVNGIFEGEFVYAKDGSDFIPDAVEVAVNALEVIAAGTYSIADRKAEFHDHLGEIITFVTRHRHRNYRWATQKITEEEYEASKKELLNALALSLEEQEPETELIKQAVRVDTSGRTYPTAEIYKLDDLDEMWKKSQTRDRKQMIEPYYVRMKALGPARHFALVSENWKMELDNLAEAFPNFAEVIDYLRQQFALSMLGDGRVHFPPILLTGPAGVGKTYLSQTIAEMVRTGYCEIHMEAEQNGSALCGSSSFWSNTAPGKVFDVLTMNETANPIIVVDEVDKAMKTSTYDPLAGLYSLLEPGTARGFTDLCVGFPVDASAICWILTSNDASKLPLPILSRLKVFDVPAPTVEQTKQIARRVYASLLENSHWGDSFEQTMPDDVVDALGQREPRVIRNTLLSALGNAAIEGLCGLSVRHLHGVLKPHRGGNYQETKIGFGRAA